MRAPRARTSVAGTPWRRSPRIAGLAFTKPPNTNPVHRSLRQLCSLTLLLAACHGGKGSEAAPSPAEPSVRPLAQLAAQRVIVTPAFSLVTNDALGWNAQIPKWREYLRLLDDEIAAVFAERGLKTQWVYPADLVRAMKGSPTYAVDPYSLGSGVLRNPGIVSGTRIGDPLANISVTSKQFSVEKLHEVAALFPVSIGLGARDLMAVPTKGKKR